MGGISGFFRGVVDFFINPYYSAYNLITDGISSLVNSLIDIPDAPEAIKNGSQVYNLSARQNLARLQSPQPVLYGRFRIFMDLLSQPWTEYVNNEQYLHQLMVVTQGIASLEQLFVGDTPVESLADIEARVYLPGETVDFFHNNVVTNEEVNDLELVTIGVIAGPATLTYSASAHSISAATALFEGFEAGDRVAVTGTVNNEGEYEVSTVNEAKTQIVVIGTLVDETVTSQVELLGRDVGPFYANPAGTSIWQVSFDITFPKGLYTVDEGELVNRSAILRFEWRRSGAGLYTTAGTVTFTANSNTPQRYTRSFAIPVEATDRIECRVLRISPTSENTDAQDESHWTGLRGFLRIPDNLTSAPDRPTFITDAHLQYPDKTVIAVRARATGQLTAAMSKSINGIWQRWLPAWNGTAWTEPQVTSSIAWAFADVVRNANYGLGRSDDELDGDALLALDAVWAERGDWFNAYFDQTGTAWDVLSKIARCGRAAPTYNARVFSMMRDAPRELRTAMFTDQNTLAGSVQVNFDLAGEDTPEGVLVTYHDENTFQPKTIKCPSTADEAKTTPVQLFGCTSRDQAWREGNFVANETRYRRINTSHATEMDGFLPARGDLVTLQTQLTRWGQSARVLSVAADGLTLTLDQRLDWSAAGTHQARLRDQNGEPSDPITCTRGTDDDVLVLATAPDFDIYTGSARERTQLALGSVTADAVDIVVKGMSPRDEYHAEISGVVEDDRVHAEPGPTPLEDGMLYEERLTEDGHTRLTEGGVTRTTEA